ncbi:hypothetical protein FDI40_gp466 [Agrobacterium phage Atu_ph07]|uniref:Uncharacterized protein n=1 Tax=Agrobacterium phage Atu_ph07 TaxID=2024264 RepID=A0A2L0V0C2_9CAUD|nr:hypothetical protein FDI40_gp466 [Agrobacterium phage Atu_ph07]AUZ95225.1 hypothetical protein [Agrobacterium phage Atu_ph07]
MGRPLNKKYFKGELQIVGRIFHNGAIAWVPLIRQHTNNLYSVLHNGVVKRFRLVIKPTEELAENEMNVMGRNQDGEVLPVKWIKENTVNWNGRSEQWYVFNNQRNTDIELETFYSMFVEPTVLVPGPMDVFVTEPNGFNTLSKSFQLAAPDVVMVMAAQISNKTGPITVTIKHGGEPLEILDQAEYGDVMLIQAAGRNMTIEEANLTVEVTGADLGYGGLRINEFGSFGDDIIAWEKSFSGIMGTTVIREFMGTEQGSPKFSMATSGVIPNEFIQSPPGYTTKFASSVITQGPVEYTYAEINPTRNFVQAMKVDEDGWVTVEDRYGLITFNGMLDADFFKENNNFAVKIKIKTTEQRNISCGLGSRTASSGAPNYDTRAYPANYEGEIILFASRGVDSTPTTSLYIGIQSGMSFNLNDMVFIPDSKVFSWMFASGDNTTIGKQVVLPNLNFDNNACYNMSIYNGQPFVEE